MNTRIHNYFTPHVFVKLLFSSFVLPWDNAAIVKTNLKGIIYGSMFLFWLIFEIIVILNNYGI